MIKLFFTLFKAGANEAAQQVTDKHALIILKQQINDSAKAVDAARKAVAVAIAQNKREEEQYEKIVNRIKDLEERTLIALEKGEEKIARDAAEAIAILEDERDTSKVAQERFQAGIDRLRTQVQVAETRLRELRRGYNIAEATDKTQKIQNISGISTGTTLSDAEDTLTRLQARQTEMDNISYAIADMKEVDNAEKIIERLAEAGCGTPLKTSADSVLERLKTKTEKSE